MPQLEHRLSLLCSISAFRHTSHDARDPWLPIVVELHDWLAIRFKACPKGCLERYFERRVRTDSRVVFKQLLERSHVVGSLSSSAIDDRCTCVFARFTTCEHVAEWKELSTTCLFSGSLRKMLLTDAYVFRRNLRVFVV